MKRTIIFVCIGVVVLAGTLAFSMFYSSYTAAQNVDAAVTFTPVSLETPLEMIMSGTAVAPNNFIVMCNEPVTPDRVRTSYLDVKLDGTTASLSKIVSTDKRVIAHCVTSDGRLLVSKSKDVGSEGGYRLRATTISLYDPKASLQTDITPSNMDETRQQPTGRLATDFTRYLWDPKYGLVTFVWNTDGWTLKVWAGNKTLEEVGSVPNILANAQLYVNDRFTYGAVTQDGKMFAFDFADGKLKQVDEYTPIAKALALTLREPGSKLIRCTVAKGIAIYGNSNVLSMVTADGKNWSYRMAESLEYRPDGKKRPGKESDAIVEGQARDLLREEAPKLPPDYITHPSQQIALNEDSVGMLDTLYQRLVVITPRR
jgi:hypothetical protein